MDKLNLSDIRAKFPDYADVPDYQLLGALHRKFYSDMPRDQFLGAINFDTNKQDPTAGNSFLQNVGAGIGKGMTSIARAVGVSPEFLARQGLPASKEEAASLDAPLMRTAGGKVGNVAGNVVLAAPTALIPGANTYAGAALIGGLTGGAFTEGDAADRAKAAVFGTVGGLAGKGLGDLVGWGVPKVVDRLRGDRLATQAANAQRDAAALMARDAGYVLPPSDVNPSLLNEALNGLSGKIKTAQTASARNQSVTNAAARQALGLPADAPLTADAFQTLRTSAANAGYAPIRSFGEVTADPAYGKALDAIASQYQGAARSFPGAAKNPVADMVEGLRQAKFDAGDALDMVKVLRESADKAYRTGDTGLGKASKAAATALEEQLDRSLAASGNADALKAFRAARQQIAKTYTVQKATNTATGDVAAPMLARQLDRGAPLSGDLLQIAQIAQAFPRATQMLKEAPKATSPLDYMAGLLGAGSSGPAGAAAVAARPAVRSLLLSKPYQGLLGAPPTYSAGLLETTLPALDSELLRRSLPISGGLLGVQLSQ